MSNFSVGDRVVYTAGYEEFPDDSMKGMKGTVTQIQDWGGEGGDGVRVKWDEDSVKTRFPSTLVYGNNLAKIDTTDLLGEFQTLVVKMRAAGYKVEAKVTKPAETVEV